MKFDITYSEKTVEKFWMDKADSSKPEIVNTSIHSYEGLDYEQFKAALMELVDPPLEELTDENVKHDFGPNVSDELAEKLKKYYNFRKKLHDEIVKEVDAAVDMLKNGALHKSVVYDKVCYASWEREIPEDCCCLAGKDSIHKPSKMCTKINIEMTE